MYGSWPKPEDGERRPQSLPPPSPSVPSHEERSSMLSVPANVSPTSNSPPDPPFVHSLPRETPKPRPLSNQFVSSPLNPAAPSTPFARSRPQSRAGSMSFTRIASEETYALSTPFSSLGPGQRGSMILYHIAGEDGELPTPPTLPVAHHNRDSIVSSSGDSIVSLSSDSKYPQGYNPQRGALVPYAYDPAIDEKDAPDEFDPLHDEGGDDDRARLFALRGIVNVGALVILIAGLLCLFIFYPVLISLRDDARSKAIYGNLQINSTGQATFAQMRDFVDPDTPKEARTRMGFDGEPYTLVFSDEFNVDGRTFYPGDDPFWEAMDLWYSAGDDQERYEPQQITTKNGKLHILLENVETKGKPYRSGMLQSWNKFCFTSGYIEVSLTFPGSDGNAQGYRPGVWTIGNLARPGYGATTDGTWPYSYNDCDVGTFPNQTLKNRSGPPAALHSDFSQPQYNMELSWLAGQKLSACTCPGEDHPGPTHKKGRGAPEIDVLEMQKDQDGLGHVVSQSAHFAPFTHDYLYGNSSKDQWIVYDPLRTRPNSYRGNAARQAVSGLTRIPSTAFQDPGSEFIKFGFEYLAIPEAPEQGFITWQVDGKPTARLGAAAVGPDQGPGGSDVSKRLIPEEPMSIVLNLGMASNQQPIDASTMKFPALMQVDYVRVYQRDGRTNVGCSPKDYPTANYISRHLDAYTNPQLTRWNYQWPKNELYEGGCNL